MVFGTGLKNRRNIKVSSEGTTEGQSLKITQQIFMGKARTIELIPVDEAG